ncbi:hypothetical protein [Candidatus Scalindua japonica]|uniref:hypothetical protein n=1 Tax=Candidatus Scalindua japonica TaxID=1284222 RepID=UPI000BDE633C|nr:hypothetical protein [Candidatus Scalindua japonica]
MILLTPEKWIRQRLSIIWKEPSLLELLITFVIILFAGFSVTFGVLLRKQTHVHSCHCEPGSDRKETLAKCDSCEVIDASYESAQKISTMAGNGFHQMKDGEEKC